MVGAPLSVVLSLLTVFGPISTDLYLPVLRKLTADLGSSTSTAQLTVTTCLFGLALGQLIAGPLSDRFAQGLAGGVGIVIAQAAGRDLYSGGPLLRYYGRLTDRSGVFLYLAGVSVLVLDACLLVFRETSPAEWRVTGGGGHRP